MDKHDIPINLDFINISLAGFHKDVEHLRGDLFGFSMKSVVEFLCDIKKTLAALDKIPSCVHPQFSQQRYHAIENFCNTTAYSRRVDVLDDFSLEFTR